MGSGDWKPSIPAISEFVMFNPVSTGEWQVTAYVTDDHVETRVLISIVLFPLSRGPEVA